MSITHRLRRSAQLCAVACALLVPAASGTALAAPDPLAQERYHSTYANPGPSVEEQYYSSYGEPEPLSRAQSPAPSDDTPWLPIALSISGALIVLASATQFRRIRIRRRPAAHTPA